MAGRDGVQGSDARAFAERIAGYYNRCRCVNEPRGGEGSEIKGNARRYT